MGGATALAAVGTVGWKTGRGLRVLTVQGWDGLFLSGEFEGGKMATEKSRETSAQVWCGPEASHIVMDCELAEAFANTLDEMKARISRTVDFGIETLPRGADASVFIRIQAAAGLEKLYGASR